MAVDQIGVAAKQAKTTLAQRYRQAQLQLKQARATGQAQIIEQRRQAVSALERERQIASGKAREQAQKAARLADIPAYGTVVLPRAKKYVAESEKAVYEAAENYVVDLNKAVGEANTKLANWYNQQQKVLATQKAKAEEEISEWEKKAQAEYAKALREAQSKAQQQAKQQAVSPARARIRAHIAEIRARHGGKYFAPQPKKVTKPPAQPPTETSVLREAASKAPKELPAEVYARLDTAAASFYRWDGSKYVLDVPSREYRKEALTTYKKEVPAKLPSKFVSDVEFSKLLDKPEALFEYAQLNPDDIRLLYGTDWKIAAESFKTEVEPPSLPTRLWRGITPWQEEVGERATPLGVATMLGEITVPFFYATRRWGTLSAGEKAAALAIDVATLIPVVGAISAGVRAGQPLLRAAGRVALAEIKAPITTVIHPVQTAKSILKPLETIVHPRKIPVATSEIRATTIKIPVAEIGDARTAMQIRDKLFDLASAGKGATVEVAGREIGLTNTALQRLGQGVAIHTTPDVRLFLSGASVKIGREGGLFVSPTLHTKFSYTSAYGDLPKGAQAGAIIIRDPRVLKALVPSGKVYRGAVEIEKILPAGTKLPPPSQILYIRRTPIDIGAMLKDARGLRKVGKIEQAKLLETQAKQLKEAGDKVALLIIGEPLTKAEIAQLKIMGTADTVRDIFAPAYKIKGEARELSVMLDDLAELGGEARKLEAQIAKATGREAAELKASLRELTSRAEDITRRIDARYAPRPLSAGIIGRGGYVTEELIRQAARRDTEGFARFVAGIPERARSEILDRLPSRLRQRVTYEVRRARVPARPPRVYRQPVVTIPRVPIPPRRMPVPPRPPISRVPVPPRVPRAPRVPIVPTPPRVVIPPTPPEPPIVPKPPIIKPEIEAKPAKGRKILKGAICWRQGFIWKTIYPPYGKKDIEHTLEPPPGVKVVTGPRSAYETITKLGAYVPPEIYVDMGIMDVVIKKKGKKIRFRRDPKQKTKLGYATGESVLITPR